MTEIILCHLIFPGDSVPRCLVTGRAITGTVPVIGPISQHVPLIVCPPDRGRLEPAVRKIAAKEVANIVKYNRRALEYE